MLPNNHLRGIVGSHLKGAFFAKATTPVPKAVAKSQSLGFGANAWQLKHQFRYTKKVSIHAGDFGMCPAGRMLRNTIKSATR
jgi:hypothetical protein